MEQPLAVVGALLLAAIVVGALLLLRRLHMQRQRMAGLEAQLAAARDTVQQAVAEGEQASEIVRYYAQLIDSVSDAIISTDLNFIIQSWNKSAERIYGWQASDVIGRPVGEILKTVSPQGRKHEVFDQLFAHGLQDGEVIQQRKDGTPIMVLAATSVLRDRNGQPFGMVTVNEDTTRHRQAEEALRQSEERYRTLVETSPDAVLLADLAGTIQFCNREAAHLFGAPTPEAIWGCSLTDFFVPEEDYPAGISSHLVPSLDSSRSFEYMMRRTDQSHFIAEVNSSVIHNAQGEPGAFLCIVRDITARKRSELALRESEARFRTLVESAPIGILIEQHDPASSEPPRLVYMNAAAETITGDQQHTWLHHSVHALLPPPDPAPDAPLPISYECRIVTPQRTTRWLDVTSASIEFEHRPARLVIAADKTEYKRAEEARQAAYTRLEEVNRHVQRSRDLLRTIFDSINDGLLLLDKDGSVQAANYAIANLLGIAPAQLINQSWHTLCTADNPADNPFICPFLQELDTMLRDGCVISRREHVTAADGTGHLLDMQALPIVSEPDPAAGVQIIEQVVLHIVDITGRAQMEAVMIENERFAASMDLIAIVAHEVNTPLQTILASLQMTRRALGSDAAAVRFLELAEAEIKRVGTIVAQLKDLYHPIPQGSGMVDINMLASRVLQLARGKLVKQRIRVEQQFDLALPTFQGRPDQLNQVLLNLVINAIESMEYNGTLAVATRLLPPALTDSYTAADAPPQVEIAIRDSGCGIAPDVLEHIFEPFYTTREHGTGLGLFVCHRIVTDHSGTISVESQPGEGTTFIVRLPARPLVPDERLAPRVHDVIPNPPEE